MTRTYPKVLLKLFFNTWEAITPEVWYRIKEHIWTTPTLQAVKAIQTKLQNSELELEKADLSILVNAFSADEFRVLRPSLKDIFVKMKPNHLNSLLKKLYYEESLKEVKNFVQLDKRLKEILTLVKVEEAVRSKFPGFQDTLTVLRTEYGHAERTLGKKNEESREASKRIAAHYAITGIEFVMDTLMYVLQLKAEEGDMESIERAMIAKMRYEMIRDVIVFITGSVLALSVYAGSVLLTASIALGIIAASVAFLTFYVKYLKPCPTHVHPMVELVGEVHTGHIGKVYGRDKEIDELSKLLDSDGHVILVGPSGAGKSSLVDGLTYRIATDDPDLPPSLRDTKVFKVSAGDLASGSQDTLHHLELIQYLLRGYEGKVILFIDEIQSGFDSEQRKILVDKLKLLMDSGSTAFPYIIFATTQEEYTKYVERDVAFIRRLKHLEVKPTDETQTRLILSHLVETEAPDLIVDEAAIKAALDGHAELSGAPLPWLPVKIMQAAIAEARCPEIAAITEEKRKIENERNLKDIQLNLAKPRILPYSKEGQDIYETLNSLQNKIDQLQGKLNLAKQEVKNYENIIQDYIRLRNEITALILKIKAEDQNQTLTDHTQMSFLLKLNYMQAELWKAVQRKKQEVEEFHMNLLQEFRERQFEQLPEKEKMAPEPMKTLFQVTKADIERIINKDRPQLAKHFSKTQSEEKL
jgi:ABC-type multidrug transport system ATPase subunit